MSNNRAHRLITADTVYGLMQQVHDTLHARFTSNGRSLDSNEWRTCNVYGLESAFWKAVQDRDFGSVLAYSAMLAGRDVNVADLIADSLEAYSKQVEKAQSELKETSGEVARKLESKEDAIRLQRITIDQHEATIRDLRAKLEEKGIDPDGFATATLEDAPYLSHEVEEQEEGVRTITSGDPQSVISLVLQLNEQRTVTSTSQPVLIDTSILSGKVGEEAIRAYENVAELGQKPKGR